MAFWYKISTSDLLLKIFQNKGYNVIIVDSDITTKTLWRDSNYIAEVIMWPKFGNSSISMREVTITSILWGFDQNKRFFEGWCWFKFNNLRLALGMTFKFYASMVKGLKLKVKRFGGVTSYVCRSYRRETGRGTFLPPPPPPNLNRVTSE